MIPLYTPAQVRRMDEQTIAAGTSSLALMERAASHLARAVRDVGGHSYGLRVLLVCGKGNNGGDGLAAATRLRAAGVDARVHLVAPDTDLSDDAAVQLSRYRAAGGREHATPDWDDVDVVVDCLLGTGSSGAPRGVYAAAVAAINQAGRDGAAVVACDLPTGVDADTGAAEGESARADLTLSLGAHKRGLWLWPARERCGRIVVADIGLEHREDPVAAVLEDADVAQILGTGTPRLGVSKRDRGVVVVLAGSEGMSGAATMVARGAMQMGVGLITVATAAAARDVVAPTVPEALTLGVDLDDPDAAFHAVAGRLEGATALAIGPGLGHDQPTVDLVRRLVREVDMPLVLDADGLNAFRDSANALRDRRAVSLVCTPHAREFARLLGEKVGDVWPQRLAKVSDAASRWGATIVAKGPGSLVQSPGGDTWINSTGNAALATGGTGDVLTGMLAAADSERPEVVAAVVHVHGRAGEIAAMRKGARSVTAMDVAAAVPAALASLEER